MSDTRFYDSKTQRSFNDFWVGAETSYAIVNPKAGYTNERVSVAYRGSPESQGYEDIRTSEHPDAVAWRLRKLKAEKQRILERLEELKDI
jgi:hypothetical protein